MNVELKVQQIKDTLDKRKEEFSQLPHPFDRGLSYLDFVHNLLLVDEKDQ